MSSVAALSAAPRESEFEGISAFVHHELELLDQRRFEEWTALFTDDGAYWAPIGQEQADPNSHVSLFYDDVRTMKVRIARLRHPRIHVQTPPSRTIHLVSNFRNFEADGKTTLKVRCNFIMFEFRMPKGQQIYGGTYDYELRRVDENWRIRQKKATLVNSDDMFPSLSVWF